MTHRDGTTDLRAGHSLIEIAVVLVIIAALAPPVLGSAGRLHTSFSLRRAQEEAARHDPLDSHVFVNIELTGFDGRIPAD